MKPLQIMTSCLLLLLTSISEYEATGQGDLLGMLSSVIELADASGQSISDFVTLTDGKLEFSKDAIISWAEAWVDALDIDDAGLKDFLKEQVASTYEAEEAGPLAEEVIRELNSMLETEN